MNYLISVVIPTFNRLPILKLTLQMYDEQEDFGGEFELIVVDDGSIDETWNYLSDYNPTKFSLSIYRQTNQGPAKARNLAISKAKGEYLVITGDDIVPCRNFLAQHYQAHQNLQESSLVLGKVVWHPQSNINSVMRHIDGVGAQQFSYYYIKDKMKLDFRHFYTSNISFQRILITKLDKLFDTDFYLAAYEDIELGYRIMGNRNDIVYHENIVGYHHHHYTLRDFCKRQYSAGKMAYIFKNKHPIIGDKIGFRETQTLIKNVNWNKSCTVNLTYSTVLQEYEDFIVDFFENHTDLSNDSMNDIYSGIFRYFYLKGILCSQYKFEADITFILLSSIDINLSIPIKEFVKSKGHILDDSQVNKLKNIIYYCSKYTKKSIISFSLNKFRIILKPIKSKLKLLYLNFKKYLNTI